VTAKIKNSKGLTLNFYWKRKLLIALVVVFLLVVPIFGQATSSGELSFSDTVSTESTLSANIQAIESERQLLDTGGLIGFTGDYVLENFDKDEKISVIVFFETEPAAVQVEEAQSRGLRLSEEVADLAVEASHDYFNYELTSLFAPYTSFEAVSPSKITIDTAPPFEVEWEYRIALNGVAMSLPAGMLEELVTLESVRSILPNHELRLPESGPIFEPAVIVAETIADIVPFSPPPAAGVAAGRATTRANDLHAEGYKGEGVLIAMMDSGIYWEHPAFEGSFPTIAQMQARGATHLTNTDGININGTYYYVGRNFLTGVNELPANNPSDRPPSGAFGGSSHGTHVAGIMAGRNVGTGPSVLGMAPEANIITYRLLVGTAGSSGATTASFFAALERAVLDRVDVVNASIGYMVPDEFAVTAATSVATNNVMLANPNMVVVVSAGNLGATNEGPQGRYTIETPGNATKAISVANVNIGASTAIGANPAGVGSFNTNRNTWSVQNTSGRGPVRTSFEIKPDLGAHGNATLSVRPPWHTANLVGPAPGYGLAGGTSSSAPHIAGAAALLVEYSRESGRRWTANEIKVRLMNSSTSFGAANISAFATGSGYMDVYAAAQAETVVSVIYDRVLHGNRPSNAIINANPYAFFNSANFSTTETGSFSFGNVGIVLGQDNLSLLGNPSPNVRTLEATIENTSEDSRTYILDYNFISNPGTAAMITFSNREITVEAGETETFSVTVTVRGLVAQGNYEGHIFVREGSNLVSRLPFALVHDHPSTAPLAAVNVPAQPLSFNMGSAEAVPAAIDSINVLAGTNLLSFLNDFHDGFPATVPTRAGHVFDGWYLDAAFTIPLSSAFTMPSTATNLFALWSLDTTPELEMTLPSFSSEVFGQTVGAQAITIANTGTGDATITSVSLASGDTTAFEITGSGTTVPAGENIQTWMIAPAVGLDAGSYVAVVSVGYTGSPEATATASIAFTVDPATLTIEGFNISKVHDGTNAVTNFGSLTFGGLVGGDTATVDVSGVNASFADIEVGTHAITFAGDFAMTGGTANPNNYIIVQPTGITGTITQRVIVGAGLSGGDHFPLLPFLIIPAGLAAYSARRNRKAIEELPSSR